MLEQINQILGTATPVAVILTGGFFAVRLRGRPFSSPRASLAALRGCGAEKDKGNAVATPTKNAELDSHTNRPSHDPHTNRPSHDPHANRPSHDSHTNRSSTAPRPNRPSPFKSLMLALAGTLGVGNIVGVASAIALGGAGAVFWMWISALFAMFLKYAEVVLALRFRETLPDGSHRGGAPYYIRAILTARASPKASPYAPHQTSQQAPRHPAQRVPRLAVLAASVFAALCLANSLMMGCVIQSNAVARAMQVGFGVPPLLCGVILAVLCLTLLMRGKRAITAVCGVLVPLMSAAFLLLSLAILAVKHDAVFPALRAILADAFSPMAAGGGVLGFLLSRGLRFGTIRGIISNEAGCGTSPTAHAASTAESPVEQGILGVLEVAVDTLVLCTVTALVILIHYDAASPFAADPMTMTLRAYSAAFGAPWIESALSIAILCFGFATLLCWSHYGAEAVGFLADGRRSVGEPWEGGHASQKKRQENCPQSQQEDNQASRAQSRQESHRKDHPKNRPAGKPIFPFVFALFAVLGAVTSPALVWSLTDLITSLMTLLNVTVLLLGERWIREATEDFFGKF